MKRKLSVPVMMISPLMIITPQSRVTTSQTTSAAPRLTPSSRRLTISTTIPMMMLLNQMWLNFIRMTCSRVGIGLVRTLSNFPSRTRCSTVSSGERMNTPHAPQLIWYRATSTITSK